MRKVLFIFIGLLIIVSTLVIATNIKIEDVKDLNFDKEIKEVSTIEICDKIKEKEDYKDKCKIEKVKTKSSFIMIDELNNIIKIGG